MGNNTENIEGYNLNNFTGNQVVAALLKALQGSLPPNGSITVEMLSNLFKLPKNKLDQSIVDELNKIGKIDDDSIETQMLKDKIISVAKLADDVASRYENLFDFDAVVFSGSDLKVTISGLQTDDVYSFNAPVKFISSGGVQINTTQIAQNHYTINGTDIRNNSVLIAFTTTQDYSKFMFVKGSNLPSKYVPYGSSQSINSNLTKDIYHSIQYNSQNVSSPVNKSGLIFCLQPNRIYSLDLGEIADFRLPKLPSDEYAQILVQATVTVKNSITWGTDYFFGGNAPDIVPGRYNLIWEHDNGKWYAGAIFKEEGESV